jgi:Tol biopolymer transport system component
MLLLVASPAHATYRGKNGRIAIAIDRGNGQHLYAVRPSGGDLSRLTDVLGAQDPDWSPDGTQIAFDLDPSGGEDRAASPS